tara:strand:+ start:85 stop:1206 length:1122 start_codon:yes stop_codon:yes gene_type:complete
MTHNDDQILIFYFLFSVASFILFKVKYFDKFFFYYALLVVSFLVVHHVCISTSSTLNKYIGTIIKILTFLLVITIVGKRKLLIIYPQIMFVLCAFNLIFYLDHVYFYSISQPLSSLFSQLTTWSLNIYYENYIFYAKPVYSVTFDKVQTDFTKNSGIFGEGGFYQYFICLALIINLFFNKKSISDYHNLIFIIAIITTYSTVAYINLFFIVLAKIYDPRKRVFFFLMSPIILFGTYIFFNQPTIYNKLFNVDSMDFIISTQRRMIDTFLDLKIIQDQPLLGIGLDNKEIYKTYVSQYSVGGASSSNGLFNYIAGVGIIGAFISLYPFFMFGVDSKKKFMLLLCNIFSGVSQGVLMTPIFFLSMSLLYTKKVRI